MIRAETEQRTGADGPGPQRGDAHVAQEHGEAHAPVGLLEGAGSLFRELQGVAHDYVVLAALETKRAGQSLVVMVAAGVMMAILLISAWLGLVAAGVIGMIAAGMATWLALLIAVVANLLVAAGLYGVIHYKRRDLAFPATVRNLRSRQRPAEGVH